MTVKWGLMSWSVKFINRFMNYTLIKLIYISFYFSFWPFLWVFFQNAFQSTKRHTCSMRHTTLYLINVKSLAAVSSFLHKALNPNYNFSTLAAYYLTFDVLSDNGENYRPNYKGDNVIKMELSRC